MDYLKAQDISKQYKVGKRTVYHWIELAQEKKLELELVSIGSKTYIADSPKNEVIITELAQRGKKFKNRKTLKLLTPRSEFYKIYTEDQIIDIIKNLEVYKEIPLKYSYMNGGAESWDRHATQMWEENIETVTPNTYELLEFNKEYLYKLIEKYKKVNVIDIGPGNALPVKDLLSFLHKNGKLRKYLAIDYSAEMLSIVEKNLKTWFCDDFPFEGHVADITSDSFQSILFKNLEFEGEEPSAINLILYLGGTIENDRSYAQQLRNINSSMGKDDIFVLEQGLDTEHLKHRLTFGTKVAEDKDADLQHRRMVLDLLNINPDFYDVERYYSETEKAKVIKVVFKVDVTIAIKTKNINKSVSFSTLDSLLIWRYNSHTMMDVMNEMSTSGYKILQTSTSIDEESVLVVSKLKQFS